MQEPIIHEVVCGTGDFADSLFFLERPDGTVVGMDFYWGEHYEIDNVRSGMKRAVEAAYRLLPGSAAVRRYDGQEVLMEDGEPLELGAVFEKLGDQIDDAGVSALTSLPEVA